MSTNVIASSAYADLLLTQIRPHPKNRSGTLRDDDPKVIELAQSVREMGVLEPIIVREIRGSVGDARQTHELLAGERRWRASRVAERRDIPCRIITCDDQVAFEIRVIENLQREDLDPLIEAAAIAEMYEHGWDVAEIAARCGKHEQWIHRRARLCSLTTAWSQAWAKGELDGWGVGHLEVIARLEPTTQDELATEWFRHGFHGPDTVELLIKRIEREVMHLLKTAGWKLDDADLVPAAGACSTCTKRSACQQQLFGEQDPAKDRCLDVACFATKTRAWVARRETELREKHGKDLVLLNGWRGERKDAIPHYHVSGCKKTTPGARPALIVAGENAGAVQWVRPPRALAGGSSKATSKKPVAEQPLGERVKVREAKLEAKREKRVCELVVEEIRGMKDCPLPSSVLLSLIVAIGTSDKLSEWEPWPQEIPESNKDGLWSQLRPVLVANLSQRTKNMTLEQGLRRSAPLPDIRRFYAWADCTPSLDRLIAQAADELPAPKALQRDQALLAIEPSKKSVAKKPAAKKPAAKKPAAKKPAAKKPAAKKPAKRSKAGAK